MTHKKGVRVLLLHTGWISPPHPRRNEHHSPSIANSMSSMRLPADLRLRSAHAAIAGLQRSLSSWSMFCRSQAGR